MSLLRHIHACNTFDASRSRAITDFSRSAAGANVRLIITKIAPLTPDE